MTQLFANNASSALAGAITSAALSIPLTPGTGVRFPSPTAGQFFLATLIGTDANGNENAWEIVYVTANASDMLTVQRQWENTTAEAWPAGTRIELRDTAGTLAQILAKSGDTATGKMHFTATDSAETALGSVSGTVNIDCSLAATYSLTPSAATTLAFINPPAAGRSQVILLKITNGGAQTFNFPSGTKGLTALGLLTSSGGDWLGVVYDADLSVWVVFALQKAVV